MALIGLDGRHESAEKRTRKDRVAAAGRVPEIEDEPVGVLEGCERGVPGRDQAGSPQTVVESNEPEPFFDQTDGERRLGPFRDPGLEFDVSWRRVGADFDANRRVVPPGEERSEGPVPGGRFGSVDASRESFVDRVAGRATIDGNDLHPRPDPKPLRRGTGANLRSESDAVLMCGPEFGPGGHELCRGRRVGAQVGVMIVEMLDEFLEQGNELVVVTDVVYTWPKKLPYLRPVDGRLVEMA